MPAKMRPLTLSIGDPYAVPASVPGSCSPIARTMSKVMRLLPAIPPQSLPARRRGSVGSLLPNGLQRSQGVMTDHHHHTAPSTEQERGAAYAEAYAAAQPDPGHRVVAVEMEAREFDWEFVPGVATRAWGFNETVPGPTLEADVGDVLEIRLTNRLSEPTVVHWHGLRIPAAMDGTQMVQSPVAPGDAFTYRFRLPDAGTFWYHSHFNETVQLERGLYGALIVRAPGEAVFDADRTLVLDDVELGKSGEVKPPGWWLESHDGREGSTRLVNGKQEPEIHMAAGQIERWR